jgi:hypothetical protein
MTGSKFNAGEKSGQILNRSNEREYERDKLGIFWTLPIFQISEVGEKIFVLKELALVGGQV